MKFNEKLQKLRKEKGYSQEQLADLLEVSRQSVSKWESGLTYPEMDKMLMLCKIFNVSLEYLTNDDITDKGTTDKEKNSINSIFSNILDMINKSVEMFKQMTKQELNHCLTEMLITFFILLLCLIPFNYIDELARDIFLNFDGRVYSITYSIWNFCTSVICLILFITVLIYIFKTRYLDKFDYKRTELKSDDNVPDPVESESITIEPKEEKHSMTVIDVLGLIFSLFWKFILLMMSIPIVIIFGILIFITVIAFGVLFKGIMYPGVIVVLLSFIILTYLVMETTFKMIGSKKVSFQKVFLLLIIGLSLCSIGSGIMAFEIAETKIVDTIPISEKTTEKVFVYDMDENYIINNNYFTNINYKIDDNYDNIEIRVNYYDDFINISVEDYNNIISFHSYENINIISNIYHLIIDNLKEKTIYNYSLLYDVDITVISSQRNIDLLKENSRKYKEEIRMKWGEKYKIYN